jgi:hypothetical protein
MWQIIRIGMVIGAITVSNSAYALTTDIGDETLTYSLTPTPIPPGDTLSVGMGSEPDNPPSNSPWTGSLNDQAQVTFYDQYGNTIGGLEFGYNFSLNYQLLSGVCCKTYVTGLPESLASGPLPIDAAYLVISNEETGSGAWAGDVFTNFLTITDGLGDVDFEPAALPIPPTPLPATLPLFVGALGMIGLLGARKRRKAQAA